MFNYHSISDEEKLRFYQTPKVLIESDIYKGLGLGEKQMYAVLRDRQELSKKNNWVDDKGNIYLIYSDKNLSDLLGISEKTVERYRNNLLKYNLLKWTRQGRGNPNRLYIGKPVYSTNDTFKNRQNDRSRTDKMSVQEQTKCPSNDTKYSETEFSDLKDNVQTRSEQGLEDKKDLKSYDVLFNALWKKYPSKKGKARVSVKTKKEIEKIGEEEFLKILDRYLEYVSNQRATGFNLNFQNGSTFFNGGYLDYLEDSESKEGNSNVKKYDANNHEFKKQPKFNN